MVLHIEDVEGNKSSVQRMWPNSQEPSTLGVCIVLEPNTSEEVVEKPQHVDDTCPDGQLGERVPCSRAE
jgi:hypothetical protein